MQIFEHALNVTHFRDVGTRGPRRRVRRAEVCEGLPIDIAHVHAMTAGQESLRDGTADAGGPGRHQYPLHGSSHGASAPRGADVTPGIRRTWQGGVGLGDAAQLLEHGRLRGTGAPGAGVHVD